MAEKVVNHPASGAIAALAGRQHGVLSAAQLYSLGFSGDQVRTRAHNGWLHRLHQGVYCVGHRRLSRHGIWMAAALAGGEGAALSHRAAGELWEIIASRAMHGAAMAAGAPPDLAVGEPIDVTVPTPGGRARRPGLVIHRSQALAPADTERRHGIPVTSVERTIVDLGAKLTRRGLERAVDEAHRLHLTDADRLQHEVRRHPRRPGTRALRLVLASHAIGSTVTRSELEERFLAVCRRRSLPPPEVNVRLGEFIVDFLWREAHLVVEADGRQSHATHAAFQRDRDRDSSLSALGFTTLRFTWWDVTRRPAVVADRVRRVLDRRRAPPGGSSTAIE